MPTDSESQQQLVKKPLSTSTINWICFLFSFIPALYLWGANWKILGKKEKARMPISLSFLLIGVFPLLIALDNLTSGSKGIVEFLNLVPTVSFAMMFFFYKTQHKDIEQYNNNHITEKKASKAKAVLVSVGFMLVIFASSFAAATLVPNPAQAALIKAREFIGINEPEKAIIELNRAIDLKSDFAEAYLARGIIGKYLGDDKKADEDIKHAMTLKPELTKAYENLKNKLEPIDYDYRNNSEKVQRAE